MNTPAQLDMETPLPAFPGNLGREELLFFLNPVWPGLIGLCTRDPNPVQRNRGYGTETEENKGDREGASVQAHSAVFWL